jgi:hypothetical protein
MDMTSRPRRRKVIPKTIPPSDTPIYDLTMALHVAEGLAPPDPSSLDEEERREARVSGLRLFLVPFINAGLGSTMARRQEGSIK